MFKFIKKIFAIFSSKKAKNIAQSNILYVGNLSYNVKTNDLKNIFAKFGKMHKIRILNKKHNGKVKKFAFIEFDNTNAAIKAQKSMSGTFLKSRRIKVDFAHSKEQPNRN